MKITWFRHAHENRNDLLRFGFMRLHYGGQLRYVEKPFANAGEAGFSQAILEYPDPRHLSFILVENGRQKIKCLVDNEDSFALITPLISEVDVCFCAGYNTDFFEKKQFVKPYTWQDETDISWYKRTIEKKIYRSGAHFHKIRKFVPIAPNQGVAIPVSAWKQKYYNIAHRINKVTGKGDNFSAVYQGFEIRDAALKELRKGQLKYDVVLNDSLWGWPQHRVNLHHRLQELEQKNYRIHSILNWTVPSECDGGSQRPVDPKDFPIKTSPIDQSYEVMLSQSRLAVFACGFHWGWRNIMMLALNAGIPVLTDRLLTEPYFDMTEFAIFQQESNSWESIEPALKTIDENEWEKMKKHNQEVYDRYMSPEAVAGYFLHGIEATPYPHEYVKTNTTQWKTPA